MHINTSITGLVWKKQGLANERKSNYQNSHDYKRRKMAVAEVHLCTLREAFEVRKEYVLIWMILIAFRAAYDFI